MDNMDKQILEDYIDACEMIKETEKDIEKLKKKRKIIVQDSVSGSNQEFPYEAKRYKVQGSVMTMNDEIRLAREEKILEERKKRAEDLKEKVEEWLNTIPIRMHRIIKYRNFENMTWDQVSRKMGRKTTENSVRMEYERFMKNN